MKYGPIAFAAVMACAATSALAGRFSVPANAFSVVAAPNFLTDHVVKIKNDKDKDQKKVNSGKPNKPKNDNSAKNRKEPMGKQAEKSRNTVEIDRKMKRSKEDRVRIADQVLQVRAPDGRDMRVLLGAAPLVFLGPQIGFADVSGEQLLTYRNCPPGLAKKDPPCVPPGLAKKGVTYEEWITYDNDRIGNIFLEQRDGYLNSDLDLDDDSLLLSSDQIASLYGLAPARSAERYALIDGQPVLLSNDDYASLLRINDLARVENLPAGLRVAPTAALTQDELRQVYKLPDLEPGYNYAVLNGDLVALQDDAFETLQLIRIARAIF